MTTLRIARYDAATLSPTNHLSFAPLIQAVHRPTARKTYGLRSVTKLSSGSNKGLKDYCFLRRGSVLLIRWQMSDVRSRSPGSRAKHHLVLTSDSRKKGEFENEEEKICSDVYVSSDLGTAITYKSKVLCLSVTCSGFFSMECSLSQRIS